VIYFNENDPYAAQWLRNLWPRAAVDEASIVDLTGEMVAPFAHRAHFFAGIGGWEYALTLAGWPADRQVWTGSCPCQPFSAAGKRLGTADARHLWPNWLTLITECRPATIIGEQVASKAGREWLAGVRTDLEGLGYAVGAADLCAAGVGAPHIRQRLFWVADADSGRCEQRNEGQRAVPESYANGGMGDANGRRREEQRLAESQGIEGASRREPDRHGDDGRLDYWSNSVWLPCLDGKARRTQPGLHPLAHGVPARVGRLRAYSNAIVPPLAAQFILASLEAEHVRAR